MNEEIIYLHRAAPEKPLPGAPCNGCGVCCAAETCPAARLLFRQKHGPCPALLWQEASTSYRCGLLLDPEKHVRWLPHWLQKLARAAFSRWIAAGRGCDSWVETISPESPGQSGRSRN